MPHLEKLTAVPARHIFGLCRSLYLETLVFVSRHQRLST